MSNIKANQFQGPHGALFFTMFLPDGDHRPQTWVIHCPAFGEEMNKSRPMVSLQARAFADDRVRSLRACVREGHFHSQCELRRAV